MRKNWLKPLGFIVMLAVAVGLVRAGSGSGSGSGSGTGSGREAGQPAPRPMVSGAEGPWQDFRKPSPEVLRERLDPLQYRVTQEDGTEFAFENPYWDLHQDGIYVDVVSGEPLFASPDKYDSGTGWPSFVRPLDPGAVVEQEERGPGRRWSEVRSRRADSHLGHVFEDGPAPTGLRYCINSAALRFIPVGRLEAEGYGDFLALFAKEETSGMTTPETTEIATLAGGCFWGMEDLIRELPGVLSTEVGYTGGTLENPTYPDVSRGNTGHAESIQVTFDPSRIRYEEVLQFFFRIHDPTTRNRQGNDRGSQYRSAIFYHDATQREIAERVKAEVNASGKWKDPLVTEIVEATPFYSAEEYHQDYLEKHPDGYTCHYIRD